MRRSLGLVLAFVASAVPVRAGSEEPLIGSPRRVSETPASGGGDPLEAPPFRPLADLASDFRHLASRESLLLAAAGAGLSLAASAGDGGVSGGLARSEDAREILGSGRVLGGAAFELGAAASVFGLARLAGNRRVEHFAWDVFRAQFLSQTMTQGLKLAVRRTRPDGSPFSFPSGHTSVSFASATVVHQHFGWKAAIPAYGFASYVAASRMAHRRHYLSDVTFGAALGILAGRSVTWHERRPGGGIGLAPYVAKGVAGVSVSWPGPR